MAQSRPHHTAQIPRSSRASGSPFSRGVLTFIDPQSVHTQPESTAGFASSQVGGSGVQSIIVRLPSRTICYNSDFTADLASVQVRGSGVHSMNSRLRSRTAWHSSESTAGSAGVEAGRYGIQSFVVRLPNRTVCPYSPAGYGHAHNIVFRSRNHFPLAQAFYHPLQLHLQRGPRLLHLLACVSTRVEGIGQNNIRVRATQPP
jgi:hypothetical protein